MIGTRTHIDIPAPSRPPRMRRARGGPRLAVLALVALAALGVAPSALAFDTGAHVEIATDALASEGFGGTASQVVQVNEWFVDLYENADKSPYSGHGGFWETLVGGGYGAREDWPQAVVDAADRSHFDSTNRVFSNVQALTVEWERLQKVVAKLVREARDRNDPLRALTVLGISLHQVQDFYAHTNWVERNRPPFSAGPDWAAKGYGAMPTWFDVPAAEREKATVYSGGSLGIRRSHGTWKADGNASLENFVAKDWEGRPYYLEAHMAAYFASRQWVRAVRGWVADEAFWTRVRTYANAASGDLAHDVKGMFEMSAFAGHWKGQGEPCQPEWSWSVCGKTNGPGGSLEDLGLATGVYFRGRAKTLFRRTWEEMVVRVGERFPAGPVPGAVASSQPLQRGTSFVRFRVTRIDEVDDRDLGFVDQADWYAHVGLAGQRFRSAFVFGKDHFAFAAPNHPFTFLKAIPKGRLFPEPLVDLRVEVRTADVAYAGTDDDVYLRVGPSTRFQLDKKGHDDFERGDRQVYSAPIDAAVMAGMTVGDIRSIGIEKSPDGSNGGWRIGGIKVWANGRLIYANDAIDRSLAGAARTWTATDYRPVGRSTRVLPVWLRLMDDDAGLTFGDDHTDVSPYASRKDFALAYDPLGPGLARESAGGRLLGYEGDGDEAKFSYRLDTIVPQTATVTATAR